MYFPLVAEEFLCRNDLQVAVRAVKRGVSAIKNKFLADFEKLGDSVTHVSDICDGNYSTWCIEKVIEIWSALSRS